MLATVFLILIYDFIWSVDFYEVHFSVCAEEFYFMF